MDLLDPFEIDHRHDADLQVGVLRQVDARRRRRSHAGPRRTEVGSAGIAPVGEGAGRRAVELPLPPRRGYRCACGRCRCRPYSANTSSSSSSTLASAWKWVKLGSPCFSSAAIFALHRLAVVAVEGVALDERRLDLLAAEDLLEDALHGGRAGARRAGDRDDRDAWPTSFFSPRSGRNRPRWPNSGERSPMALGSVW